ncbi:hypothetical protein VTL71DRAFT_15921 [Oculimacula yallundae]|uniref:Uncharacterized protein n=1 Tax=Oculimacula yallundae TaxID=86028 RepID=A0ABR4CD02_9HELO
MRAPVYIVVTPPVETE